MRLIDADKLVEGAKTKIDIYTQLKLNWDRFVDYLWNEYTSK